MTPLPNRVGILGLAILGQVMLCIFLSGCTDGNAPDGAGSTNEPIRLDIGGVQAVVPKCYANFLEYNGNPSPWEGGAQMKAPASRKVRSMGFYATINSSNILVCLGGRPSAEDARSVDERVILVGLTTGEDYPGGGYLDRLTQRTVIVPTNRFAQYKSMANKELDLIEYHLVVHDGMSASEVLATGESDYFLHRDAAGKVDTFIKCSRRKVPAPPCSHRFGLEPKSLAEVEISYSRNDLNKWSEMEKVTKKIIIDFDENHSN
jgi:hypothetical protein